MRNDVIERAFSRRIGGEERLRLQGDEQQEQKNSRRCDSAENERQRVAAKQNAEEARPGVLLIRLRPDGGEGPRKVQRKFVRRGILAGVIAFAAVVAEVGEKVQVKVPKGEMECEVVEIK